MEGLGDVELMGSLPKRGREKEEKKERKGKKAITYHLKVKERRRENCEWLEGLGRCRKV